MDCNLHCWYCYERHLKGSLISEDIFSSISKLIENKVVKEGIKSLSLSFFGGEPFIAFNSIVLPLIKNASKLCKEHECNLYVSFVTNGTLITKSNLKAMASLETALPVTFQIALDGNEYFHDKTKAFSNGEGSYKLILENIKFILSHHMDITLRLNMTEENLESYYDVLSELKSLTEEEKTCLTIDLQHIWQDSANCKQEDFLTAQAEMRKAFMKQGLRVNELKHIDNSRCYADRENNVSINYDGRLFNCTARDFTESNCEGMLLPNDTFQWNNNYKKRIDIKYGNDFCRQCKIFPLCHGGCSQYKLDCGQRQGCIKSYDELYIKKIVEDRVEYLLERIVN